MAYTVTFKFPDTTSFDASLLVKRDINIKESFHNQSFESSRNTCSFETVFDSTLLSKIESASGYITVEIKDGSTWLFNGILQPLTDFSISNSRDKLTFDLEDRGALLEYCLQAPQFFNSVSIQSIVGSLLTGSGVTFATYPARAATAQTVRGVFGTDKTVWQLLNQLLKEFGMVFYFKPDGTGEVVDLMVNIASTVTIDDSTNVIIKDGSLKVKKSSVKGRGEKISVQADYYDAYSQKSNVYNFAMSGEDYTFRWTGTGYASNVKSPSFYSDKYFNGVFHSYTYPQTELVLLDKAVLNYSKPNSTARYLGAELPEYKMTLCLFDSPANVAFFTMFELTVDTAGTPTLKWFNIGASGKTTISSSDYVFSQTLFADKMQVSLKLTNTAYFKPSTQAYNATYYYRAGVMAIASVKATVWLGTHVEPVKISNQKSKVESYTLDYAQTSAQVQDFLNLRSDIAINRTWESEFISKIFFDIGTGATITIAKNGFSTTGVIVSRDSKIYPGFTEYTYKLVAYSTISLTTPTTPITPASVPVPLQITTPDGAIVSPIISQQLPTVDPVQMVESGFMIGKNVVGFYDKINSLWTFKVDDTGALFAGNSIKNLTFDPTTGNLTLTGDVVAAGGTIAGWQIMSDLLRSAGSGARIELNKTKSRVSIFDASGVEVVAMGYIDGLTDPILGTAIPANTYGFWAKAGGKINLFGAFDVSGDLKQSGGYIMPVGSILPWAGVGNPPTGWLECNGQAVSKTTYSALYGVLNYLSNTGFSFSSRSGFLAFPGSTYEEGEAVWFTTSGTLPAGLTVGTTYYISVGNGADAGYCFLLTSRGGAPISAGSLGSGSHSIYKSPYGVSGSNFYVPDLRETSIVGTGQRGSGVTAHDTFVRGQFKDDQMQGHEHDSGLNYNASLASQFRSLSSRAGINGSSVSSVAGVSTNVPITDTTNGTPRTGTTTRGKSLGVMYMIKT